MGVMTRGYRNNNPGNIRKVGNDNWNGLAPAGQQIDSEFLVFSEPRYGVRAISILVRNYQSIYGLKSVKEIINRYAPPSENITTAYVLHVAALMGVTPDEPINTFDLNTRAKLVDAIIVHENGYSMYSTDQIREWTALI